MLRALFGFLLLMIVAALTAPFIDAVRQQAVSNGVISDARASRAVFAALQFVRLDRGPTRAALEAKDPADPAFLATTSELRAKADPAIEAVLAQCATVECAEPGTRTFTDLKARFERLVALRAEVDGALRQPLPQRREGLAKEFNALATDVVDRLETMVNVLCARLRLADAETGKLMSIKQMAWLARDGVGLERTAFIDGLGPKGFTPALQTKVAELRGRSEVSWAVVRELTGRGGVDAVVAAKVARAEETAFGSYDKLRKAMRDALAAGQPLPMREAEFFKAGNQALDDLVAVPNTALAAAERHASGKAEAARGNLLLNGGQLALALLIGAVGFLLVQRRITGPIVTLTGAMRRLAEGDLSAEIAGTERADEIGSMSRAVAVFKRNAIEKHALEAEQREKEAQSLEDKRRMMDELALAFEADVRSAVQAVADGSAHMQTNAEATSRAIGEARTLATGVAVASEEASVNVQTVAAATEELAATISEVSVQVNRSATIARDAKLATERTDGTVQGLASAAERIGAVLALISSIAEKTNLLALNATIEAARAGEAGRGFAVVASEVKHLAGQTGKATEEIQAQIASIQGITSETVTAMRDIGGIVHEMDRISASIAGAVDQQHAATEEIARNIQQASKGSQEVSQNIGGVAAAATTTGAAAEGVLRVSSDLAAIAVRLGGAVDGFVGKVRAA